MIRRCECDTIIRQSQFLVASNLRCRFLHSAVFTVTLWVYKNTLSPTHLKRSDIIALLSQGYCYLPLPSISLFNVRYLWAHAHGPRILRKCHGDIIREIPRVETLGRVAWTQLKPEPISCVQVSRYEDSHVRSGRCFAYTSGSEDICVDTTEGW